VNCGDSASTKVIRERLSAEGALRTDDLSGRTFVLAEKLDAHSRALSGSRPAFDGPPRPKSIVDVLPRREKSLDQVLAEAFPGGTTERQLSAAADERLRRNAEQQRQAARSVRAVAFAEVFAGHPGSATEIRLALDAFMSHFTTFERTAIEKFPELVRANAAGFAGYYAAWRRGERAMAPVKHVPSPRDLLEVTLLRRHD
jgi:hypothetical protein